MRLTLLFWRWDSLCMQSGLIRPERIHAALRSNQMGADRASDFSSSPWCVVLQHVQDSMFDAATFPVFRRILLWIHYCERLRPDSIRIVFGISSCPMAKRGGLRRVPSLGSLIERICSAF